MVETARDRTRRSAIRRVLGGTLAVLSLTAVGPASLLVLIAETRQGRLFGGVAACVLIAAACGFVVSYRAPANIRPWVVATVASLTLAGFLMFALVRSTPTSRPERSTGLLSRCLGNRRVPAYSPLNLLPEIDQVKLGVTLATRFVPWVSRARTIRKTTMGLYREIEADPESRGLGPVTHFAALELVGADFDAGHSFVYVPESRPGERLGAVVFLHGNGGNFQVVPWAWRSFAEENRCIILCPTFGFGFWGEGGVEAVDRAWDDARGRWPIDPARVYLAGLSDGGVGVTRSALAHPERYRGLIYVSPTMKLEELGSPEFEASWKGRPVLVFQGDRDWSVVKRSVDPAIDLLRRRGVDVDYRVVPGEDHFLFFSRRAELFDAIGGWMTRAGRVPSWTEKAGEQ
jgi:pimeloyl-ACP methyl ester carboxylesterase